MTSIGCALPDADVYLTAEGRVLNIEINGERDSFRLESQSEGKRMKKFIRRCTDDGS